MFMSSAEVFRTRQAVRDLVEAVEVHRDAMHRLGVTGADRDAITRITADGRLDAEGQRDTYSTILLAAAMPDDDFGAFIGATLLLLADRLQGGISEDDLFHNWAAFREHYHLADPPVRAALMNGFRLAKERNLIELVEPPNERECVTFSRGDVVATLQSVGLHDLGKAVRNNVSAEEAGALWQHTPPDQHIWQLLVGFRYLYERPESMAPPTPKDAPLIPWV